MTRRGKIWLVGIAGVVTYGLLVWLVEIGRAHV